jgi:hypothetical protein
VVKKGSKVQRCFQPRTFSATCFVHPVWDSKAGNRSEPTSQFTRADRGAKVEVHSTTTASPNVHLNAIRPVSAALSNYLLNAQEGYYSCVRAF